jgi:hypothetical protein
MERITKTINPIHFEDLEPHRFEDLVRQLIYDFRSWSAIEAVGRLGSDEGIDIKAIEKSTNFEAELPDDNLEDVVKENLQERVWVIQCKREKYINPKKVEKIVSNDLLQQSEIPHGYMIIAACDFSKKARDTFRSSVIFYGVEEFYLWGKAEIEDLLFQPKNDHLLFAYFGISLQIKRRALKIQLRENLTLKRKLVNELVEINYLHNKPILIRDPTDENYPFIDSKLTSITDLPWRYWQFQSFHPKGFLIFITRKCFAFLDYNKKEWDAMFDFDDSIPLRPELAITKK